MYTCHAVASLKVPEILSDAEPPAHTVVGVKVTVGTVGSVHGAEQVTVGE